MATMSWTEFKEKHPVEAAAYLAHVRAELGSSEAEHTFVANAMLDAIDCEGPGAVPHFSDLDGYIQDAHNFWALAGGKFCAGMTYIYDPFNSYAPDVYADGHWLTGELNYHSPEYQAALGVP